MSGDPKFALLRMAARTTAPALATAALSGAFAAALAPAGAAMAGLGAGLAFSIIGALRLLLAGAEGANRRAPRGLLLLACAFGLCASLIALCLPVGLPADLAGGFGVALVAGSAPLLVFQALIVRAAPLREEVW